MNLHDIMSARRLFILRGSDNDGNALTWFLNAENFHDAMRAQAHLEILREDINNLDTFELLPDYVLTVQDQIAQFDMDYGIEPDEDDGAAFWNPAATTEPTALAFDAAIEDTLDHMRAQGLITTEDTP